MALLSGWTSGVSSCFARMPWRSSRSARASPCHPPWTAPPAGIRRHL